MDIQLGPVLRRLPLAVALSSGFLAGHMLGSADSPDDVTGDAEVWCAELASQGYDTTDCVDTYVRVFAGEGDLGPNGEPVFEEAAGEVELPCTGSEEYQDHLDDPDAVDDPCLPDPSDGEPCLPPVGAFGTPEPCPVVPPEPGPPAPPKRLTWKPSFATKLFIGPFGVNQCGSPAFVKLAGREQIAKYATFCLATAASYNEKPLTPVNANPLDARIWAKADLDITCEEGRAVPVAGSIANGGTAGGVELPPLMGQVNPPGLRDQIAANGGFGLVTSGRPNALLEPTFAIAGGPRANPDIWNQVTGTVTCSSDANGVLKASIRPSVAGTGFPSHKVWWNGILNFSRPQGPMSVLWELPPIPNP